MDQPPGYTEFLDLSGMAEEDAKLVRHLTWLYGGYQMRQRRRASIDSVETSIHEPRKKPKLRKKTADETNASNLKKAVNGAGNAKTLSYRKSRSAIRTGSTDSLIETRRKLIHYEDIVFDHRRPKWPKYYNLTDKIRTFIDRDIASTTDIREGREPNTLSICKQFALANHEAMVADVDRIHYYRAAIFWTGFQLEETCSSNNQHYCSGKHVLEIGTGPMCVLAMNATNAGAASVDALEVSADAARLASKLMAAYGCDDRIHVFNCHSKQFVFNQREFFKGNEGILIKDGLVKLPPTPPYDMVISEILGDFASQEGVADVFLDFQRRVLMNNPRYLRMVKSIPTSASTMFIPCMFPDADNIVNKACTYPEMTIFTPRFKMLQSVGIRADNIVLCDEWGILEDLKFEEWMEPQMCQHLENCFTITRSGKCCGFMAGIDVEVRPGEHFGTRFGHCESWYTNIILFDEEYTVYPGDIILVLSICNLTNYVTSSCFGEKIDVSRPCYSLRSYILTPCTDDLSLDFPNTQQDSAPHDNCDKNQALQQKCFVYKNKLGRCNILKCPCINFEEPQDEATVKLSDLEPIAGKNTNCKEPMDWLKDYSYVEIADKRYRILYRPCIRTIDYTEQSCAIYTGKSRHLPSVPPRKFQKFK